MPDSKVRKSDEASRYDEPEIDLREYAGVIWRRWRVVAAVIVVGVLITLGYNALQPPTYESTSTIQLSQQSAPLYATPASAIMLLASGDFLQPIAKSAGVTATRGQLKRIVRAQAVGASAIRIRVRYQDPYVARDLADAIARTFLSQASQRITEQRALIKTRLDSITAELAEFKTTFLVGLRELARLRQESHGAVAQSGFERPSTLNATAVSGALYSALAMAQKDLLESELLALQPPVVIDGPMLPDVPVAPRKGVNIVLGMLLGLIAGIVVALVLEYYTTPAVVESRLRAPVRPGDLPEP